VGVVTPTPDAVVLRRTGRLGRNNRDAGGVLAGILAAVADSTCR